MECELCYEPYNNCENQPKVLQVCGHTFCERCTAKVFKGESSMQCPFCRKSNQTSQYPPTNFALLAALDELKLERECKGVSSLLEKSSLVLHAGPPIPQIMRINKPEFLQLSSILDGVEPIYTEDAITNSQQPPLARSRSQRDYSDDKIQPKGLTGARYSFHPNSFLMTYMGFNQQSKNLWLFRKNQACRHYYSCPERFLKNMFCSSITMVLCKFGAEYLLKRSFQEIVENLLKEFLDKKFDEHYVTLGVASVIGVISAGVALLRAESCRSTKQTIINWNKTAEEGSK